MDIQQIYSELADVVDMADSRRSGYDILGVVGVLQPGKGLV